MGNILEEYKAERERQDRIISFKEQFWSDIILCSDRLLFKLHDILLKTTSNGSDPRITFLNYKRILLETGLIDKEAYNTKLSIFFLKNPQRILRIVQFLSDNKASYVSFKKLIGTIFHTNSESSLALAGRQNARRKILKLIYFSGEENPLFQKCRELIDYEKIEDSNFNDSFLESVGPFIDEEGQLNQQGLNFLAFLNSLLEVAESEDSPAQSEISAVEFDYSKLVSLIEDLIPES